MPDYDIPAYSSDGDYAQDDSVLYVKHSSIHVDENEIRSRRCLRAFAYKDTQIRWLSSQYLKFNPSLIFKSFSTFFDAVSQGEDPLDAIQDSPELFCNSESKDSNLQLQITKEQLKKIVNENVVLLAQLATKNQLLDILNSSKSEIESECDYLRTQLAQLSTNSFTVDKYESDLRNASSLTSILTQQLESSKKYISELKKQLTEKSAEYDLLSIDMDSMIPGKKTVSDETNTRLKKDIIEFKSQISLLVDERNELEAKFQVANVSATKNEDRANAIAKELDELQKGYTKQSLELRVLSKERDMLREGLNQRDTQLVNLNAVIETKSNCDPSRCLHSRAQIAQLQATLAQYQRLVVSIQRQDKNYVDRLDEWLISRIDNLTNTLDDVYNDRDKLRSQLYSSQKNLLQEQQRLHLKATSILENPDFDVLVKNLKDRIDKLYLGNLELCNEKTAIAAIAGAHEKALSSSGTAASHAFTIDEECKKLRDRLSSYERHIHTLEQRLDYAAKETDSSAIKLLIDGAGSDSALIEKLISMSGSLHRAHLELADSAKIQAENAILLRELETLFVSLAQDQDDGASLALKTIKILFNVCISNAFFIVECEKKAANSKVSPNDTFQEVPLDFVEYRMALNKACIEIAHLKTNIHTIDSIPSADQLRSLLADVIQFESNLNKDQQEHEKKEKNDIHDFMRAMANELATLRQTLSSQKSENAPSSLIQQTADSTAQSLIKLINPLQEQQLEGSEKKLFSSLLTMLAEEKKEKSTSREKPKRRVDQERFVRSRELIDMQQTIHTLSHQLEIESHLKTSAIRHIKKMQHQLSLSICRTKQAENAAKKSNDSCEEIQKALDEAQGRLSKLSTEILALRRSNVTTRQQYTNANSKLSEAKAEIAKLNEQKKKEPTRILQVESKKPESKLASESYRKQLEELKNQLETAESARKSALSRSKSLCSQLSAKDRLLNDLQQKISIYEKQTQNDVLKIDGLETKVQKSLGTFDRQLRATRLQLKQCQEKLANSLSSENEIARDLSTAKALFESKNAELNSLSKFASALKQLVFKIFIELSRQNSECSFKCSSFPSLNIDPDDVQAFGFDFSASEIRELLMAADRVEARPQSPTPIKSTIASPNIDIDCDIDTLFNSFTALLLERVALAEKSAMLITNVNK